MYINIYIHIYLYILDITWGQELLDVLFPQHKPTQSKPRLPGVFRTRGGGLVGELRKYMQLDKTNVMSKLCWDSFFVSLGRFRFGCFFGVGWVTVSWFRFFGLASFGLVF